MQAEIAKANEAARETEQKLTEKINANATKLQEANHALDQKSSALDRAIRAGRVRLPAPSCAQAPAGAASAPANQEDGSESDRQTLLLIAQIAADGDRAINQLNACIDAYNEVREALNGQR
jgi:prophage endopeptidase